MIPPELARRLPPGISAELDKLLERDGHNSALDRAMQRLPILLAMSPQEYERTFAQMYQRTI